MLGMGYFRGAYRLNLRCLTMKFCTYFTAKNIPGCRLMTVTLISCLIRVEEWEGVGEEKYFVNTW